MFITQNAVFIKKIFMIVRSVQGSRFHGFGFFVLTCAPPKRQINLKIFSASCNGKTTNRYICVYVLVKKFIIEKISRVAFLL